MNEIEKQQKIVDEIREALEDLRKYQPKNFREMEKYVDQENWLVKRYDFEIQKLMELKYNTNS